MITAGPDPPANQLAEAGALALTTMPPALLDAPLDYLLGDHGRQRRLLEALRRFSLHGFATRDEAVSVATFMGRDLPLHHSDEDEDLFPLLRRRALRIDDLAAALDRLSADHRMREDTGGAIIATLKPTPGRAIVTINPTACAALRAYAAAELRHLAVENAVVLPIARIRLKGGDLAAMSAAMKARRRA